MSESEPVLIERDGPVRVVTMNRPEQRNAFRGDLRVAMHAIWDVLADDDEARAVVLTGAGSAFCAGGDFENFARNAASIDHRRKSIRQAARLTELQLSFHLPLVAAVNGPAVGLGCSLAVLSDLVVMAEGAYFADTHVSVGLVAGDGGAVAWPFMMSMLQAKRYLLLGDRISATDALALGLANEVVPSSRLLERSLELAHRLAAQPRQAVQETKRALNLHIQQAAHLVLPFALAAESESFTTEDVGAAIERFRTQ